MRTLAIFWLGVALGLLLGKVSSRSSPTNAADEVQSDIVGAVETLCDENNSDIAIYLAPEDAVRDKHGARIGVFWVGN